MSVAIPFGHIPRESEIKMRQPGCRRLWILIASTAKYKPIDVFFKPEMNGLSDRWAIT